MPLGLQPGRHKPPWDATCPYAIRVFCNLRAPRTLFLACLGLSGCNPGDLSQFCTRSTQQIDMEHVLMLLGLQPARHKAAAECKALMPPGCGGGEGRIQAC